jgi:hypothetical protein
MLVLMQEVQFVETCEQVKHGESHDWHTPVLLTSGSGQTVTQFALIQSSTYIAGTTVGCCAHTCEANSCAGIARICGNICNSYVGRAA